MSIGTKIVLEGEKEYRSAIYNVNQSISTLKSEMRAVSAEFDGNANSVDALRKKNEVLSKQQAEQEKRIALLRGAIENATKVYGENSNEVLKWQRQLNNASAQLLKINRDIEDNQKYMKEAEQSTDKTAKSINEFGKQIEDAGQKTSIFGDVLKANLASDAISDGVRKLARLLGDSIEQSIELASDLEEVQNVVDVTFGKGAENIDRWAESMGDAHGVSVLFSKEFAGIMGSMLKSMDLADDQVLEMSKNLVELAGDMASFYNVDTQTMFEKIRSGISGQIVPLQQLGINLKVSSLEAFALAEGMEKTYAQMDQAEQTVLRYNYLMKVTADAQGDFTRNIDSLANQQRIADLQREEMLMKLGDAVIPAVTRATAKLNEAMDGMGDNLAEVAEILAEGIVDAFVWMIDNSDKIIAGLKGIGMAILTKKAGDGVLYVVSAYKALTSATVTATVAQEGFNTASKANVYIAIASAIIGVATALGSYVKSASDAAEETRRLNDEAIQLIESSKKTSESIQKNIENRTETLDTVKAQISATKSLIDSLYDLDSEENKNNSVKEKMLALIEQINQEMPNLNLTLDEQTGLLNKQREEVEKLLAARIELSTVEALQGQLSEIALDRYNQEQALNDLLDARVMKEKELADLEDEIARNAGYNAWETSEGKIRWLVDVEKDIKRVNEVLAQNEIETEAAKQAIAELTASYEEALNYIGDHSAISVSANAMNEFGKKLNKALEEQTKAEIGTLADRQKQVNKIYEEAGKELDKKLREEERAFAKSQQKRVEEVQKAQEKELKELEKAQKVKLDLLNKEYLEKIKVVDEDRYKELKKIQDEIDAIDAQQEAEDRALKLREEAEQRAELQARIENSKTIEERMEAQKDLQRHEEKVAKNRLKEERGLQKDILKEQKDTINKGFDEKIKAIEEEQKAQQKKLEEQYNNEKTAIAERYKLKLEALKEEQELEKDALRERQTEYKDYLREQKELAIANSKEIYEADLAEFKLKQALKYEETMSSEAQMKKAIKDYAINSLPRGIERDTILKTSDLSEMLQFFDPSIAIKSSVPQTPTINYSLIESAMTNALKKLNLSVKIDKKEIGQVVDERIGYNLRR